MAGLYDFNDHVSDTAATPNSMRVIYNTPTQATYVPNTFCTADTPEFVGQAVNGCPIDRASQVNSKSYAIFGQATWNVNEKLHITAGGRYTWDEKQGQLNWSRNVDYRANPAIAAANGYRPLDEKWRRFNPLVTVAYDVNNEVHAYAKYATGYRAGGASSRTSDYRAFNPEDVKSYEIGVKADLFGRRARLNLAGYMMDRTGSQVDLSTIQPTVLPTGTSNFNNLVTFNAPGTTKIRGVEADLTVKPVSALTVNLSYAYTYTDIPLVPVTYTQFSSTGTALFSTTVNQKFYIVYTPRNAASASVDYELPEILGGARPKFHVDANYAQATQSFDQFATKADSSFIVNARLSVLDIKLPGNDTKLNIGLWSRNLFDHQYVYRRDPSNSLPAVQTSGPAGTNVVVIGNNSNVLGDYGNFNMPRTFGFDASIKF